MADSKKNPLGAETALYRKYRPRTFDEVVGQEPVVKALAGAIKSGAIAHAYLFAGSRGIGKTSIARIFAREIGTSANDLTEIDAASNRGIDDVREIRESVYSLPFESRYKVYIVDEVHMLTKEAFNALLKTLEEPPAHVTFVLATTDPQKVKPTIRQSNARTIRLEGTFTIRRIGTKNVKNCPALGCPGAKADGWLSIGPKPLARW